MRNCKYCIFLISIFLFAACNQKKTETAEQVILRPAEIDLNAQDTIEINQLVDQYVSLFIDNDLQGASSLLNVVNNDSIRPLSEEERTGFVKALSIFHFYDYKNMGMIIRSDKNNEIDLAVQIIPDGDISKNQGVTHFYLNPVKIDGHWYLTLLDNMAEGVHNIYKNE